MMLLENDDESERVCLSLEFFLWFLEWKRIQISDVRMELSLFEVTAVNESWKIVMCFVLSVFRVCERVICVHKIH